MSDSGFVDEAEAGRGRTQRPRPVDSGSGVSGGRRQRRRSPVGIAFVVLLAALVGFTLWAWAGRVHVDDVAAYTALRSQIEELDRSLTPLGHSEIPPCRDSADGVVTRTYPPSTGPQAAEVVGFLTQKGWTESPATVPVIAHLTRVEAGHELTIDLAASSLNQLVDSLTAHSPASAFGCVGH
jgi:hypothetical protein